VLLPGSQEEAPGAFQNGFLAFHGDWIGSILPAVLVEKDRESGADPLCFSEVLVVQPKKQDAQVEPISFCRDWLDLDHFLKILKMLLGNVGSFCV